MMKGLCQIIWGYSHHSIYVINSVETQQGFPFQHRIDFESGWQVGTALPHKLMSTAPGAPKESPIQVSLVFQQERVHLTWRGHWLEDEVVQCGGLHVC